MAKVTDTHLSLGMDEENNFYINYHIRMRLPQVGGGGGDSDLRELFVAQLVGGFKSNWKRVMKLSLSGAATELSDESK